MNLIDDACVLCVDVFSLQREKGKKRKNEGRINIVVERGTMSSQHYLCLVFMALISVMSEVITRSFMRRNIFVVSDVPFSFNCFDRWC